MSIPGSAAPFLLAKQPEGQYLIERSLRFNSSDSAYLGRTPSTAGNRKTWTWAGWVKKSSIGAAGSSLWGCSIGSGNPRDAMQFQTDQFAYEANITGSAWNVAVKTTQVFRDASAWYHIVAAADTTQATAADRIKIYVNGTQVTSFATATYPSQNDDLPTNQSAIHYLGASTGSNYLDGYLADIHFIDGQALDPTSFGEFDTNGIWQPKAYTGTYGTNGFHLTFSDNSTAGSLGDDSSGNGNNWTVNNLSVSTTGITPGYASVVGIGTNPGSMFDLNINSAATGSPDSALTWSGSINLGTGKFYVIVNAYAISSQGPSGVSLTVNGSTYSTDYFTLRSNSDIHNQQIGLGGVFTSTADGRRTNLTPSISNAILTQISCGPTGGGFSNQIYAVVFVPSGVGDTDFANHVVVQNVDSTVLTSDSLVDVPTNGSQTDTGVGGEVRGNYCCWNPLQQSVLSGSQTLSNGNLDTTTTLGGVNGTIFVSSGKWYWETTLTSGTSYAVTGIGQNNSTNYPGFSSGSYGYVFNGNKITGDSGVSYGATYTTNDVIGVALDLDAGTLVFYKNGVSQGTAYTGLSGSFAPRIGNGTSGSQASWSSNFGQRPFAYTAPSGFKALNTANLPSTTITTSGSYTGNGVADGPFVYLNGVPTAMTIGGNSVTFGTDADKLSNGFKIRTTSTTYNQNASVYNYTITSTGAPFKTARAQSNP